MHLYEMDTKIAYDWLRVRVDAKHPSFQNCTIDTSDSVRDGLKLITEKIIEEAITTTDPDIIGISSMLDAKDERKLLFGSSSSPHKVSVCNNVLCPISYV